MPLPRLAANAFTSSVAGCDRFDVASANTIVADCPLLARASASAATGAGGGARPAARARRRSCRQGRRWRGSRRPPRGGSGGGAAGGAVGAAPAAHSATALRGAGVAACTVAWRGGGGAGGRRTARSPPASDALAPEPRRAAGRRLGGGGGGAVPTPNRRGEAEGEDGSASGAACAACCALVRSATSDCGQLLHRLRIRRRRLRRNRGDVRVWLIGAGRRRTLFGDLAAFLPCHQLTGFIDASVEQPARSAGQPPPAMARALQYPA